MSSEKEDLKAQVGKLGLYLIEQAKERIKELNQQILFRKAEIKKKYREQEIQKSKNLRAEFIDKYEKKLNTNLSATLLASKQELLDLKNNLIKNFKDAIRRETLQSIDKRYSNYINYLLKTMMEIKEKVKSSESLVINLNLRDFNYFSTHISKVKNIFGEKVVIKESSGIDVGGFKLEMPQEEIIYNYSLENTLNKNFDLLEQKISNQVKDARIKDEQDGFEKFVEEIREKMEDTLIIYDRI